MILTWVGVAKGLGAPGIEIWQSHSFLAGFEVIQIEWPTSLGKLRIRYIDYEFKTGFSQALALIHITSCNLCGGTPPGVPVDLMMTIWSKH